VRRSFPLVSVALRCCFIALLVLVVSPLPAHAQTCSVSGTIRNASGAVVPNAAIRIIDAKGTQHSVTADNSGHYCAYGLPQGRYTVMIDKPGFRSIRLDAVTVAASHPAQADATMSAPAHPEEAQESAPATGGAPAPPSPVVPPAAPAPSPQPPAQADQGGGAADTLSQDEAKWISQLKKGSIVPDVPQQMTIGTGYTATVTIYGYKAAAPAPGPDGIAPAPTEVSDFMRVDISQDDNPDAFTIVHGDNPDQQFVPMNGTTTWKWTVTPKELGSGKKLNFQAFVIYSDPKLGIQQALPAESVEVSVQAEGVHGILNIAETDFWLDPMNWIKYVLPGGAGFAALVSLIGWGIKRKKVDSKDGSKE
jgi:Carboxypeptidase regulatory-like domain